MEQDSIEEHAAPRLSRRKRFAVERGSQDDCWKSHAMETDSAACPIDLLTCTLNLGHTGQHVCPNGHTWW